MVSNFQNKSSFYELCFFVNILFKNSKKNLSLINYVLHNWLNPNMYQSQKLIDRFLSLRSFYLATDRRKDGEADGQTSTDSLCSHGNSSRYVKKFTRIKKLEDDRENIMPSHYIGKT